MRYLCGLHDYALHNVSRRILLEVQAVFRPTVSGFPYLSHHFSTTC
jgi:hypothetical protein